MLFGVEARGPMTEGGALLVVRADPHATEAARSSYRRHFSRDKFMEPQLRQRLGPRVTMVGPSATQVYKA
jgi:hypothetical protein